MAAGGALIAACYSALLPVREFFVGGGWVPITARHSSALTLAVNTLLTARPAATIKAHVIASMTRVSCRQGLRGGLSGRAARQAVLTICLVALVTGIATRAVRNRNRILLMAVHTGRIIPDATTEARAGRW